MNDSWEVQRGEDGIWKTYRILRNGTQVAYGKWTQVDSLAELHDSVDVKSPSVLKKAREVFRTMIQPDVKQAGLVGIAVIDKTIKADALRLKYWEFMGFDVICRVGDSTFSIVEV